MTNRDAAYNVLRDHANEWVNGMDLIAGGAGTRFGGRIDPLQAQPRRQGSVGLHARRARGGTGTGGAAVGGVIEQQGRAPADAKSGKPAPAGFDPDMELYLREEAATLRDHGWLVQPPRWQRGFCIGVTGEGCMVRTNRLRCRYCNRTRYLRWGKAA